MGIAITFGERRILSPQYGYFPYMTRLDDGQLLILFATGEDELPVGFEVDEFQAEKPFRAKPARAFLEENERAKANAVRTFDTAYWTIRSTDGGRSFHDYGMPCCICVTQMAGGVVVGLSRLSLRTDKGTFIKVYRSFDTAATWDGPDYVPVHGPANIDAKECPYIIFHRTLMQTASGAILVTAYTRFEGDTRDRVVVYRSTDNLESLHYFSTVAYDPGNESPYGIDEPVMERAADGALVCVMRTNGFLPLVQARSTNEGASWSDYSLVGTDGVDPDLARMDGGILACSTGRPGVSVLFCEDGRTWRNRTTVYNAPYKAFGLGYRERWDREKTCGYTSIRETGPGRLLIAYSAPVDGDASPEIHTPLDASHRRDYRIWGIDVQVAR